MLPEKGVSLVQEAKDFILEAIVCSVPDAIEAERGGANRLEVVRELRCGGLTPDIALVRAIRRAVSLPLRVILRDNEDDSIYSNDANLRATALQLQDIGVDGIVIGFVRNGNADLERTKSILDAAPQLNATFHHAFDDTESPLDTIAQLKQCGRIDRVLSSGGAGELPLRAARLELYRRQALGEITVLAGGGLDEGVIRFLRARTGIREFHVGRAARSFHNVNGSVSALLVKRLRRLLLDDNDPTTLGSYTDRMILSNE